VITFFSIPKAFEGDADQLQRNAVGSWLRVADDVEVILFGADRGVAEAAAELGVAHVPEVAHTEFGTPLIDGTFAFARSAARNDLLCFVNADIVLLDDFGMAARRLRQLEKSFLAVGESWDVALDVRLDFGDAWQDEIRRLARRGRRRGAGALDFFLYTPYIFSVVPAFAVGRVGFDNWLVWRAGASGARVVDISRCARVVHQRHDYRHVAGGRDATRHGGVEGSRNLELAGGKSHLHTRYDATHVLGPRRLYPNLLRPFRLKENLRKAFYKIRAHTPWPPGDRVRASQ